MTDYYSQYHPKSRTGKECKKTECERYNDYLEWMCGTSALKFCMECRNAHVSQYKRENNNGHND